MNNFGHLYGKKPHVIIYYNINSSVVIFPKFISSYLEYNIYYIYVHVFYNILFVSLPHLSFDKS